MLNPLKHQQEVGKLPTKRHVSKYILPCLFPRQTDRQDQVNSTFQHMLQGAKRGWGWGGHFSRGIKMSVKCSFQFRTPQINPLLLLLTLCISASRSRTNSGTLYPIPDPLQRRVSPSVDLDGWGRGKKALNRYPKLCWLSRKRLST